MYIKQIPKFPKVPGCKATACRPPLCCEPPHTPSSPGPPAGSVFAVRLLLPARPVAPGRRAIRTSCGWGDSLDPVVFRPPLLGSARQVSARKRFQREPCLSGCPQPGPRSPWEGRVLAGPLVGSGQLVLWWPLGRLCPGWLLQLSSGMVACHTVHLFRVQFRGFGKHRHKLILGHLNAPDPKPHIYCSGSH